MKDCRTRGVYAYLRNYVRRYLLLALATVTRGRSTVGPVFGGSRFVRDGSAMSLALAADQSTYDDGLAVLRHLVSANDDVVDVGANIGVYSCTMARLNAPNGRVWAIEPSPTTFIRLQANALLNSTGRILCLNAAAGDKWRPVCVLAHARDDSQNKISSSACTNGALVVQAPLDDLICSSGNIGLLKIDVEGAELLVLSGAKATLRRSRAILIEIYEPNLRRFGASSKEVLSIITREGFKLFYWAENELVPLRTMPAFTECTDIIGIRQ